MPVSKRNKVVSLSTVTKKTRQDKEKVVEDARNCATEFKHAFVFTVLNMRNSKFKEMRQEFVGSRFFIGKNKLLSFALGRDKAGEVTENMHMLTAFLHGDRGILFTNNSADQVINFFDSYMESNYARTGFVATTDFAVNKGILDQFPFSLEPQLRKLGLPTRLNNGRVELEVDTVICRKGDSLNPSQCKLLELFGVEMAVMKVLLLAHLDLQGGNFREFEVPEGVVLPGFGGQQRQEGEEQGEEEEEEEESKRVEAPVPVAAPVVAAAAGKKKAAAAAAAVPTPSMGDDEEAEAPAPSKGKKGKPSRK